MSKIFRKNKFGYEEVICTLTGEVLASEELSEAGKKGRPLKVLNQPDERCNKRGQGGQVSDYPYTQVTSEMVLYWITEGLTLKKISKLEGMPSAPTLYSWLRKYPDFKAEVRAARGIRAEIVLDQIFGIIEASQFKVNWKLFKNKVKAYNWLAGRQKVKPINNNISKKAEEVDSFILNTGISNIEFNI